MIIKNLYKLDCIFICVFIFGLSLVPVPDLFASGNVDSLKQTLLKKNGLEKANTLIKILDFYHNVDPDSAYVFSEKLIALSEDLNYQEGKLAAIAALLNVDFIKGNYNQCIRKAIPYLQESYTNPGYFVANIYLSAGNCYGSLGLYKAGVELYLKAKSIFLELDEKEKIQTIENNLGAYYIRMGDFKSAESIFERLNTAPENDAIRVTRIVNLGFINLGLKNYDTAEKYFTEALTFGSSSVETRGKAISSFKLGDLYNELEEYEKAIKYYTLSLGYFSDIQNTSQTINPLIGLASCYLEMNNLDEAKAYALKAEELGNSTNTLHELVRATTILADIFSRTNEFQKAYEYAILTKNLSDSLSVSRKNQEIQILETEFEFKLREDEIRRIQEAELKQQKLYLQIVIAGFFISLVFAFVIFRSKRKQDEANEKLGKLNSELEETNEIKNQLFSIIAHDLRNPLSSLYGMITLLETKSADKKAVGALIPHLVDQFKHTSNLLNNLLNWSKSQMEGYKVIPTSFDINEVFEENIELLKSRFDEKRISVHLDSDSKGIIFADENMINLVVLNLLSNALKYSEAGDSVTISKKADEHTLTVQVKDTGVGIPQDKIDSLFANSFFSTSGTKKEKGTGLGLMLCKEFISRNGGEIWVDSELGVGTTFYFTLPISPREAV